jgi:hypothetical protein
MQLVVMFMTFLLTFATENIDKALIMPLVFSDRSALSPAATYRG